MSVRSGILIFLLLLAAGTPAQASSNGGAYPEPERALTQFRLDRWTPEDGLPASLVEEVIQTKDGFLWLGTQSGLVRFDGLEFKLYDKSSHPQLISESVNAFYESADGSLWAGTRTGGLIRYQNRKISTITTEDGLPSNEIGAITEDRDGVLWVGLVDSSVVRVYPDGTIRDLKEEVGVSITKINALLRDPSGAIWIGTRENGLFLYNNGVVTSFRATGALDFQDITALAPGPDGSVWVGSRGQGLARMHGYRVAHFGSAEGLGEAEITSITTDPSGAVWIGTGENGLLRYFNDSFERLAIADGLSNDAIKSLTIDREGSLWIGTGNGLNRLRDSRFVTFGAPEGLPQNDVLTVMEGRDGTVWIGAGGLARIKKGSLESVDLDVEGIYALEETPDGSIWVGGPHGLKRYAAGVASDITAADGYGGQGAVYGLYTDPDGDLWVAAADGLYHRQLSGDYTKIGTEDGLSSNAVTFVTTSHTGALWVGTYDGGLNRYDDGEVTGLWDKENGLLSNFITAVYEDPDGVLWFGAREAGLYRLEGDSLQNFTSDDGLPGDYVYSIQEDGLENLWVSTDGGLYRVGKAELSEYASGDRQRISPVLYGQKDGLRSAEFNGGIQPAGWRSQDGRLWFPSVAGVVAVDPYQRNTTPPLVVLERFLVGKTDFELVDGAEVEAGASRYEFDFTSPGFLAPAATRFQYRLEGFDREWTDAGTDRKAHYTNLRPGSYTFRVRAQNADGIWSESEARLSFDRLPHFWETAWFRLLALLAISLAVLGAFKWRMRQIQERARHLEQVVNERTRDLRAEKERTEKLLVAEETARRDAEEQREIAEESRMVIEEQAERLREMDRVKTRFFNNISHEFRTPLTLNIGPMENALMGMYGDLNPEMGRQVEVMLRNSRRLLRLINQLLDLSKLESGKMKLQVQENSLADLVEGIVLSFTPFAEKKQLALDLELESGEEFRQYFDPINLEKVFFNLLSNAIKFTPEEGKIGVRMERARLEREGVSTDAVRIAVSDTGAGMPAADLPHIFDRFHQVDGTVSQVQEGTGIGLSLVKELVDLHGGEIQVESQVGEGTTFYVTLPADRDWLSDHEILGEDQLADLPARGPMVEMAVFENEESEQAADDLPDDTPMILVVDDSPDVREYVASCLRQNFRVRTAVNGQEGLDRARELKPDLIVSDVMMPVMNGYDLCRAAKADPKVAQIPIILVTSKASADDKVEGLEAGADDYVAKPFSARELRARVVNLLEMSSQKNSLRRLNTNLSASNDALRTANEMKTQLLSIASHDMKNPLTAIREFSRIIREEVMEESHLTELLDLIYDSSNEMLALISQLLDSAALESGQLDLRRVEADLSVIAQRVADRNSRVAQRKGQVIHCTVDTESCVVTADPERLKEAMDNLVSNAVKYSPLQRGIFVSTRRDADEVIFSVRDEGPGLTGEDKKRLFGKFQKLSAQPTGGESSTGLGLSIVKQIVELHGGRVWAESQPGHGAVFSFSIPLDRTPRSDRDAVPHSQTWSSQEQSRSTETGSP